MDIPSLALLRWFGAGENRNSPTSLSPNQPTSKIRGQTVSLFQTYPSITAYSATGFDSRHPESLKKTLAYTWNTTCPVPLNSSAFSPSLPPHPSGISYHRSITRLNAFPYELHSFNLPLPPTILVNPHKPIIWSTDESKQENTMGFADAIEDQTKSYRHRNKTSIFTAEQQAILVASRILLPHPHTSSFNKSTLSEPSSSFHDVPSRSYDLWP